MKRGLGGAESFLDRSPDSLSTRERTQLLGKWIALQRYTPATIPVRLIAAVGDAPGDCIRQLQRRGLHPTEYEYVLITTSG